MSEREKFEAWLDTTAWKGDSLSFHNDLFQACAESMQAEIDKLAAWKNKMQLGSKLVSEIEIANGRIAQLEEFIRSVCDSEGFMINGNRLSGEVKRLLTAPTDTWLAERIKEAEVKVLEEAAHHFHDINRKASSELYHMIAERKAK